MTSTDHEKLTLSPGHAFDWEGARVELSEEVLLEHVVYREGCQIFWRSTALDFLRQLVSSAPGFPAGLTHILTRAPARSSSSSSAAQQVGLADESRGARSRRHVNSHQQSSPDAPHSTYMWFYYFYCQSKKQGCPSSVLVGAKFGAPPSTLSVEFPGGKKCSHGLGAPMAAHQQWQGSALAQEVLPGLRRLQLGPQRKDSQRRPLQQLSPQARLPPGTAAQDSCPSSQQQAPEACVAGDEARQKAATASLPASLAYPAALHPAEPQASAAMPAAALDPQAASGAGRAEEAGLFQRSDFPEWSPDDCLSQEDFDDLVATALSRPMAPLTTPLSAAQLAARGFTGGRAVYRFWADEWLSLG